MSSPVDRNPSPSKLRALAGTFLFVGVLAALGTGREKHALAVLGAAATLALATLFPPLGRRIHIGWMSLGLMLGRLTSPVILGVIFALVVVPVACMRRLVRRCRRRPSGERDDETYWKPVPKRENVSDYFRPF